MARQPEQEVVEPFEVALHDAALVQHVAHLEVLPEEKDAKDVPSWSEELESEEEARSDLQGGRVGGRSREERCPPRLGSRKRAVPRILGVAHG